MPLDPYTRRRDAADAPAEGEARTVQRYDTGGELARPHFMADGTMLVEGRIARPGILRYVDADGNVTRELLPFDELHRADSLGTLGRVPVTIEHPDEDVTPDNVERLGVGDVDGLVERDDEQAGGFVRVKMAIRRADAIEAVRSGKVELSPGYRVIVDPTPGVHPQFGAFDAIQRGRIYNHVALVDVARGGRSIHLRADGAARQLPHTPDKGGNVNPILIALLASLGVERPERFDSDEAGLREARNRVDAMNAKRTDAGKSAAEVQRLTDANAELQAQLDAMTARFNTLSGVADALKIKADAAEAEVQAKADAAEREHLTALAGRYDGADALAGVDLAAVELGDLRKAIAVAHLDSLGSTLADDASEGYVAGILSTILASKVDADGADRIDADDLAAAAWSGLGKGSKPAGKRDAADDKTPTQNYFDRADAAFNAARAGGAA